MFAEEPLPKPPSFNEEDVSDKPEWVRNRSPLSDAKIAGMRAKYQKRLETLQAVDEMVGKLIDTLATQGELDNTYIFYTSDNGYHMGQHRLPSGKTTAYEEDIRVPYLVRGPGIPAGRTLEHMVLSNDLAPTFADLGSVAPPAFVDGHSLSPLLTEPLPESWRTSFLIESYFTSHGGPPYSAVRTTTNKLVRYSDGVRELYRLTKDPFELRSRHKIAPAGLRRRLNVELDSLKDCTGDTCRTAEGF